MPIDSTLQNRIRLGLLASGKQMKDLASSLNISKQVLSNVVNGHVQESKHHAAIAKALGCEVDWLVSGDGPAPKWWTASEETEQAPEITGVIGEFAFAGTVTAGDGWVQGDDEADEIELRRGLRVVKVTGDSAYPVVFPGQYVLVDPNRKPNHENMVVCQTDGQALLKRYLENDSAPGGFALVSVNVGQSVHLFSAEDRPVMWPVVAILFPRAFKRAP